MTTPEQYDVALSFAGEDRAYVEKVAEDLNAKGVRIFYDEFEKVNLWGKNLYEHFIDVYQTRARYSVIFVSKDYKNKVWSKHEHKAVQARALSENREYILPARFDDTEIEGLLPTTAYIDLREYSPAEFSVMICEKIDHDLPHTKSNQVPSPNSQATSGEVTFDYSSFDGCYRIGNGACLFETKWSKASDTSIYCLNDPPSISGVALAPKNAKLAEINDASALDYTSRHRTPEEHRIVLIQNNNGFYAALKILDIKDDRMDDRDKVTFRYWILTDGGKDFSIIDSM